MAIIDSDTITSQHPQHPKRNTKNFPLKIFPPKYFPRQNRHPKHRANLYRSQIRGHQNMINFLQMQGKHAFAFVNERRVRNFLWMCIWWHIQVVMLMGISKELIAMQEKFFLAVSVVNTGSSLYGVTTMQDCLDILPLWSFEAHVQLHSPSSEIFLRFNGN